MPQPPDGTGTVFVNRLGPAVYTAIWQGSGPHAGAYADIEGGRDEVLAWVGRCRAAAFLAFDARRDDYVTFRVDGGRITDLPL